MLARGLEFGWRRVPSVAQTGPASWQLAATVTGGAAATLSQLNAVAGPGEQAETTALVARMTVPPSTARRTLIDAAIAGLKADGVWTKLDWLVVTAAHDAQAARLNWRAAKVLAAVNSPIFTSDRGYAGDGVTAYLDFGEAPNASGNQFSRNAHAFGAWLGLNSTQGTMMSVLGPPDGPYVAINNTMSLDIFFASNPYDVSTEVPHGNVTGLRAVSRAASAVYKAYRNAVALADLAVASSPIPVGNLVLLRFTPANNHFNGRIAAAFSGSSLTPGEMAALHGRLNTFLIAIGAN